MQFIHLPTEKTVTSPYTGRCYAIRRIGWKRRNRLLHQVHGDMTDFSVEMIKACCTDPKLTDADLDNAANMPSSELDWLYSEITKFDLISNLTYAPQPAPTESVKL